MTDLPRGWILASLNDISVSVKNGIFVSRPGREPDGVPILRVSSVRPGELDISDLRYSGLPMTTLAEADALLKADELLFTRYNGNVDYVGACARVPSTISYLTYPDKLIRVRLDKRVADPRFVAFAFESPAIRAQVRSMARTTAGQAGISGSNLRQVRLPIPPLAEQHKIVELIDEQLSYLQNAKASLSVASGRTTALRRSYLAMLRREALSASAEMMKVGSVAETALGKMVDSQRNTGEPTPYLRNLNVRWGRIDETAVETVPMSSEERKRFALSPGDLLVCEGGEPGRCAIWRGTRPMAYQKAIHRVRPNSCLNVEWLAVMLEEAVRNGRTDQLQTGTTIKHLPQEKLRLIEIPVPPLRVQLKLLESFSQIDDAEKSLVAELASSSSRIAALRNSILTRTVIGNLVSQLETTPIAIPTEDQTNTSQRERPAAVRRKASPTAASIAGKQEELPL